MSSSFTYSVDQREDDPSELFEEGYFGIESSQQFDSSVTEPISETAPIHNSGGLFDCDPTSERTVRMEMPAEEGYALRQWRSENAIKLEEKEKKEKELMGQIIVEAQEFKMEFLKKTQAASETNKNTNREKEKEYLGNQEKFHSEADKNYWKSIAELIPKEVVAINTISSKKVVIQQGPKPGKPTDLSRMRQILLKLKHHTPPHFINFPSSPASEAAPEVAVA